MHAGAEPDPLPSALEALCGVSVRPARARTRVMHPVARRVLPRVREIEVHGAHHVPAHGAVVLAPNHIGFLDGLVVGCASPRPTTFLVYAKAFTGAQGLALRAGGALPLPQDTDARHALGQGVAVLRRGEPVAIFPEGARGRGRFEVTFPGVAWLVQATGAPVVPVAVLGTRVTGQLAGAWPAKGRPLVVEMGAPLRLARPGGTRRAARDAVMAELLPRLVDHVVSAQDRHGIALPEDIPPDLLPD